MISKIREPIIVTGGAGFIGSKLTISLANKYSVRVIDNLSTSLAENIRELAQHNIKINKHSLESRLPSKIFKNCQTVFHLASYSDVKESMLEPYIYFENNVKTTMNLLELMRKNDVNKIIFTSSSVVYGETKKPVDEKSSIKPISFYGMTKSICESLIESYCNIYGFKGIVFRLANIVGTNSPKGLIYDMMIKFTKNPKQIIILGNGKQTKSYLHVNDCVNAIMIGYDNMKRQKKDFEIFNVSGKNFLDVNTVVKIIGKTLGHSSFSPAYKKYDKNGRGWFGDITNSKIDVSKLERLQWTPTNSRKTIVSIVREMSNK